MHAINTNLCLPLAGFSSPSWARIKRAMCASAWLYVCACEQEAANKGIRQLLWGDAGTQGDRERHSVGYKHLFRKDRERASWRGKNERRRKEEGAPKGMLPVSTYAPVSGSGPGKVSRHSCRAATPHRVIEGQECSLCRYECNHSVLPRLGTSSRLRKSISMGFSGILGLGFNAFPTSFHMSGVSFSASILSPRWWQLLLMHL